ncbi:MAG: hypothetical protein QJR14_03055 [Bacillota bacterium]|nr:hypothetical protein [Bacillota bacterium]
MRGRGQRDRDEERLAAEVAAELREEAVRRGDAPPAPREVLSLLGLVREELAEAELQRLGLAALGRLVVAEARFLPAAFWGMEAGLVLLALVAADLLERLRSPLDAWALAAPWLGTAAVLAGFWPRRGAWQEVQALSPLPAALRLLAKAGVALGAALVLQTGAGLIAGFQQTGWSVAPVVRLVLLRDAPLLLAAGWSLLTTRYLGSWGGLLASLGLWVALEGFLPWAGSLAFFTLQPGPGGAALAASMAAAGLAMAALALRGAARWPAVGWGRDG